MSDYAWDFGENNYAEQFNTLVLLDNTFEGMHLDVIPTFYILGGTALLFHGISTVVTLDIDVANTLSDSVRNIVEPFISDNASEVAVLAKRYESRLVPYKADVFKNIKVFLLSIEDLVITKLGAGRFKDIEDLKRTNILDKCDYQKLTQIITTEFDTMLTSKLLIALESLDY